MRSVAALASSLYGTVRWPKWRRLVPGYFFTGGEGLQIPPSVATLNIVPNVSPCRYWWRSIAWPIIARSVFTARHVYWYGAWQPYAVGVCGCSNTVDKTFNVLNVFILTDVKLYKFSENRTIITSDTLLKNVGTRRVQIDTCCGLQNVLGAVSCWHCAHSETFFASSAIMYFYAKYYFFYLGIRPKLFIGLNMQYVKTFIII